MMSVYSFKEGLKESKLKGCLCGGCDNLMLPPRMICTKCGSTDLKEHCFEGKGIIRAKTVVRIPLTKFQELNPYSVGIIELDEGPMVTGMILGEIDKINIGDRVEAVYMDVEDEKILAFKVIN